MALHLDVGGDYPIKYFVLNGEDFLWGALPNGYFKEKEGQASIKNLPRT